jgi:hypothetical protein
VDAPQELLPAAHSMNPFRFVNHLILHE